MEPEHETVVALREEEPLSAGPEADAPEEPAREREPETVVALRDEEPLPEAVLPVEPAMEPEAETVAALREEEPVIEREAEIVAALWEEEPLPAEPQAALAEELVIEPDTGMVIALADEEPAAITEPEAELLGKPFEETEAEAAPPSSDRITVAFTMPPAEELEAAEPVEADGAGLETDDGETATLPEELPDFTFTVPESEEEPAEEMAAAAAAFNGDHPNGAHGDDAEPLVDVVEHVEKILKVKRWEKRDKPFRGFDSPPGRF